MGISLKASVSSLRRVAATGLLGTGLIAAFSGAAEATPNPRPVPPHAGHRGVEAAVKPRPATPVSAKLRPPAGNVPIGTFSAKGVQIYECTGGTWEFVEPVATLFGPGDRPVAVHFRGPSWQSIRDGSLVEGKAIANVEVKGTIPHLLLEATKDPRQRPVRPRHLHPAPRHQRRRRPHPGLQGRRDQERAVPGAVPLLRREEPLTPHR